MGSSSFFSSLDKLYATLTDNGANSGEGCLLDKCTGRTNVHRYAFSCSLSKMLLYRNEDNADEG